MAPTRYAIYRKNYSISIVHSYVKCCERVFKSLHLQLAFKLLVMRKIVVFMHVSLDGFVAGPHGEMDWIKADERLFDLAGQQTAQSDTALYGRITFEMMDAYWPNAANKPNASRHDIEHAAWYNQVPKVVLSRTLQGKDPLVTFIGSNITQTITELKQQTGQDIVVFGSPSAVHTLLKDNLIDRFWLFVNPVLLGKGVPMFDNITQKTNLRLLQHTVFDSGVVSLLYESI